MKKYDYEEFWGDMILKKTNLKTIIGGVANGTNK